MKVSYVNVCGTRRVVVSGLDPSKPEYRVVCATCGAGGFIAHRTKEAAQRAAVRDSSRGCRVCGAS